MQCPWSNSSPGTACCAGRLRQHHLTGDPAPDAIAVARRVCGVHAQLAASATTAIGLRSPAEILAVDGRIVGVWTGDRRGDTLSVTIEPFGPLARPVRAKLAGAADRVAAASGATGAD